MRTGFVMRQWQRTTMGGPIIGWALVEDMEVGARRKGPPQPAHICFFSRLPASPHPVRGPSPPIQHRRLHATHPPGTKPRVPPFFPSSRSSSTKRSSSRPRNRPGFTLPIPPPGKQHQIPTSSRPRFATPETAPRQKSAMGRRAAAALHAREWRATGPAFHVDMPVHHTGRGFEDRG